MRKKKYQKYCSFSPINLEMFDLLIKNSNEGFLALNSIFLDRNFIGNTENQICRRPSALNFVFLILDPGFVQCS